MPLIMDPADDPDTTAIATDAYAEDDEGLEGAYNHTHRAFLQSLLPRGSVTHAQAKALLAACLSAASTWPGRETLPNDVVDDELAAHISAVNAAISPFDLEVRSTVAQTAGLANATEERPERIYALVNTTSDAITQLATIHTPDEIAFVKRVLDEMFITNCARRAEVYAVEGIKAVNCNTVPSARDRQQNASTTVVESDNETAAPTPQAGHTQSITKHQAATLLDTLVAESWFSVVRPSNTSAKKFYTLAPRALMELRGWLTDTYNDDDESDVDQDGNNYQTRRIKFCAACRDILTAGQRCPDLDCPARLHNHCTATMWRSQAGKEECPVCRKQWVAFGFVGVKAAVTTASAAARRRNGEGNAGDAASRRTSGLDRLDGVESGGDAPDGDEEEEEEEEEDEE
ncbi:hypothetical protein AAFC00_005995 [Neodothiora populina]|uniref:Non-structural maintenance of chromosomes element 1 homolog n=1 Tax=Neodothiora populina TaxID=2781224 RepID=A0ABR3P6L2_9PEZI